MAAQSRPSTASKTISRSTTPTISAGSKSASRSNYTPMRKPATSWGTSRASASDQSSSGRKNGSTMLKNPVSSRGVSQTVKCRQSKPSEMLSSSHDAPPRKPASASRGRPAHLSSSNGIPRQKSCSPSKVRASSASKIGIATLVALTMLTLY